MQALRAEDALLLVLEGTNDCLLGYPRYTYSFADMADWFMT
jgi:hypothetical protein